MDQEITRAFRNRPCRKVRMPIEQHKLINHGDPPSMPSYEIMDEDHHRHLRGECQMCEELQQEGLREKTLLHPPYVVPTDEPVTALSERPARTRKRSRRSALRPPRLAPRVAMVR
ncbi:MAG: hypothetical protein Q8Q11_03880 [bacterium]|nr:hypothetical protein [bacterium]MDZ4248045.1 hypothetical protein [Patescibacteria group bacterium]